MKQPQQLKGSTICLMVATALFYDVIQLALAFLLMDWLITPFAFLTFYVWFKQYGISFATPKRAMTIGGTFIIEMIPFLAALPTWTLAVTLIILDSRAKKIVENIAKG
jgi:hypothetical protein